LGGRRILDSAFDLDVAGVSGGHASPPSERRLHRHRLHVSNRQLPRHHDAPDRSKRGGGQDLVEIRGDDPAVGSRARTLVEPGNEDRRKNAVLGLEAADSKACRVSGATAEALIEEVTGPLREV